MAFAGIFPGQGSQSIGMLSALAESSKTVSTTFSEASDALGFDLWKMVAESDDATLNQTINTQLAMLAAGTAVWRVWRVQGGAMPSAVGIHYTQIGRYENKGSQPSADILSKLANALEVSSDFLTNGSSDDLAGSSLTDKELLNQFKAIEKMNDKDKSVIKTLIDAFITKGKLKQLAL